MKFVEIHKTLLLLLSVLVIGCSNNYKLTSYSSSNNPIEKNLSTANFSEFDLNPYKKELTKKMNQQIGSSAMAMETGSLEGLLGNFIADLTLFTCNSLLNLNVDMCILNNGGFRTALPKGSITRGKIFEIMPFDNQLVILELDGEQMTELINYIKKKTAIASSRKSGVPISGLRITINGSTISRVFIGKNAFNKTKTYKLVTTDYLAKGGDQMEFFKKAKVVSNTNVLLRDAIIDYIIKLEEQKIKITAELDGRVQIKE